LPDGLWWHTSEFSTGRRIGLSPPKRVVAGSSPAFGTTRRSSSVVEHVNSQFVSYPSIFQRAVDCGLSELLVGSSNPPSRSARVAQSDRAAVNIHSRSLPARALMGRSCGL